MRNITLHLTHFARPKESGVGVEVASVELTVDLWATVVGETMNI
jgi:hypothetical protein